MPNDDLATTEFVIFDVETTGLSPLSGDRIIEIAALRIKAGRDIDRFHSLVNPGRMVSPAAFAVNNISDEMLKGAPAIEKVLPDFLDFCQKTCLAGYNVNFDLGFVRNELSFLPEGRPLDLPAIDILRMARNLLPDLESHSLSSVTSALNFGSNQEHRALSDVILTARLFRHFLKTIQGRGINQFSQLLRLFGVNPLNAGGERQEITSGIQRAIDQEMELSIKYFSGSTGQVTQRRIKPIEIQKKNNKDMLVAYCHLRKSERTFSLERIIHLENL